MERTANQGVKAEALYVSKLGFAKIIPTAEKKIWGDETEQSLANQSAVISTGDGGLPRGRSPMPASLVTGRCFHLGCSGLRQGKSAAAVEHLQLK
jgi:hypothetical protein